jgi:putative ABC transport system permease protein
VFDLDNWAEVFSAIRKNKLRTFLTGFSISWGIFMFVILLATSNGAKNGIVSSFGSHSLNAMQIFGRSTSIPYKGLPDNRNIIFEQRDYDLLNEGIAEKEYVSACSNNTALLSYASNYAMGEIVGIYPDYAKIRSIKIIDEQGRLISDMDMKEKRKVAVINKRLREVLYKNENPVGKKLTINKMMYTIIGVSEENSIVDSGKAYIPFTTAQLLFNVNGGKGIDALLLTLKGLKTNEENELFSERLTTKFSQLHQFDPKDNRAVGLVSSLKDYLQTLGIFNAITIFIWIIGLGTLFAGVVGISNIMLITVRERTNEFGIRKALGAKPSSILGNIIMESVCITTLFGYFGMFLGIGISELFNSFLKSHPDISGMAIFKDPSVNVNVAIGAMAILVIAGVLAGYFPARQAIKISPVEAMRSE